MDRHDPNINLQPMGSYQQDDTGANAPNLVGPYNPNPTCSYHQDDTAAYDPSLLAAWNQGQMCALNPNPMDTYHHDNTGAYDSSFLAAWNQEQMGALNPIHVRTHYQGQTGTYDTSLVGTHGHVQMDPRPHSEIEYHQPSYMYPQCATNIDDLTGIFQLPKSIKTRSNQSPRAKRFHDGSHTTRAERSGYQNPDVQEQIPFLDTSKLNTKKLSRKPRRPREHRVK